MNTNAYGPDPHDPDRLIAQGPENASPSRLRECCGRASPRGPPHEAVRLSGSEPLTALALHAEPPTIASRPSSNRTQALPVPS